MSNSLLKDLQFGLRLLKKHPGFSGIAILTLALGIGANTSIFSVINTVLFNPLPYYKDPDRLAAIWMSQPSQGVSSIPASYPDLLDWREQDKLFEGIAFSISGSFNLTGGDRAERVTTAAVSANLFDVLGVRPMIGRGFLPEEERWGNHRVIVLGYGLWQRQFGADPGVTNREVQLDGTAFKVVGVAPKGFRFPSSDSQTQIWRPYSLSPDAKPQRFNRMINPVVARLKPGVTVEQADREMKMIARRIEQDHPDTNAGYTVDVFNMGEDVIQSVRPSLLLLLGAVGFVLLIACANVANLLLARATARHKEIAIRTTLGASPIRVVRQLLTESLLLALLGGVVGGSLAYLGLQFIAGIRPSANIPRLDQVRLDASALIFTLGLSLVTSVLFGLAPALRLSKTDLNEPLKEGGRRSSGVGGRRIFQLLVVSEVMLASMLLIVAGLMIKSFLRLQSVNLGFESRNLLTIQLRLPARKYGGKFMPFYRDLLSRIEALPQVESAAAASLEDALPMFASGTSRIFELGDHPLPTNMSDKPLVGWRPVTPTYFRTLRIPLIKGRLFTDQDNANSPPVAIINQTLANRYFANEDPLDKKITVDGEIMTVIGVVGDVRFTGLTLPVIPDVYSSYYQDIYTTSNMWLAVRTSSDPLLLVRSVQEQIRAADNAIAPADVSTMGKVVADSIFEKRFSVALLSFLGAVGLLLAAVGIYGVMAHSVSQRSHEIGVRIAMGAQRAQIYKLVLGQGFALMISGVVLGLIGALILARIISALLFDISANDPIIFVAVPIILGITALLACWIPARRAVRVDPITTLRYE
jgi:putative ABC transport system permease protein